MDRPYPQAIYKKGCSPLDICSDCHTAPDHDGYCEGDADTAPDDDDDSSDNA